jgi:ribonuclease PH
MKIKKVQLSEKDKRKAYRTAVRNAVKESGIDRQTRSVAYRNRKKYTRKGRARIIRDDINAG